MARLIAFAGLPGSGKSTVARAVARRIGATYLRIDTIEAAIVSTLTPFDGSPVGYVASEWVAQEQLVDGRDVVIDAVNGVEQARAHWYGVAERTGARLTWVHVTCSDTAEHRRRVESRRPDWPGQGTPTWEQVQARAWQPFGHEVLELDNVDDVDPAADRVLSLLGG